MVSLPNGNSLVVGDLHVGMRGAQLIEALLEGGRAVDLRLAAAREVEVGAVDDGNRFHNENVTSRGRVYCALFSLGMCNKVVPTALCGRLCTRQKS